VDGEFDNQIDGSVVGVGFDALDLERTSKSSMLLGSSRSVRSTH
jgi:hypothetical protein